MSRRLFPIAELILFAGILAGGYVIVAAAKATGTPVAASDRRDRQPTAIEAADPVSTPTPPLTSPTRISTAKPPVPLRTSRHATYWVEDPQQPPATTEGAVTQT